MVFWPLGKVYATSTRRPKQTGDWAGITIKCLGKGTVRGMGHRNDHRKPIRINEKPFPLLA